MRLRRTITALLVAALPLVLCSASPGGGRLRGAASAGLCAPADEDGVVTFGMIWLSADAEAHITGAHLRDTAGLEVVGWRTAPTTEAVGSAHGFVPGDEGAVVHAGDERSLEIGVRLADLDRSGGAGSAVFSYLTEHGRYAEIASGVEIVVVPPGEVCDRW